MSSKIDKVCAEIEKVKAKISEQQTRLRELERQKTELENTEIVELVRSLNLTPAALADFLKEQKKAHHRFGPTWPEVLRGSTIRVHRFFLQSPPRSRQAGQGSGSCRERRGTCFIIRS